MQRPPADGRHGAPGQDEPAAPAARADTRAEQRPGAHAAPYMDADGTLHNLRPIARLEVSGPDPEPKRTADTEFGGKWFTAPKEEPAEKTKDAAADTTTASETRAAARTTAAAETSTADRTTAADSTTAAAEKTTADGTAAAVEKTTAGENGLVLNLDLAGLLNGVAIETEPDAAEETPAHQPATTERGAASGTTGTDHPETGEAREKSGPERTANGLESRNRAPDAAAVRAEVAGRMAALSLIPGPEPVFDQDAAEPKKPPAALAAADLDAIRWRLDGGTLREVVDDKDALRELGERLDGPLADEVDNVAKAGLLSVRAEVYRLLGELGMAAAASRLALAHAESARHLQSVVIAQAELAHILRLRGDFTEADRLFARAAAARVPESLRSVVHENAGRCCFDQGRHMEALDHFAQAVRLGRPDDQELAERIGVCLEAVYIHVLRDGWGPYPREPRAILPPEKSAKPEKPDAFDEDTAEQRVVRPR
ncbi:tetratricopeptide repeat protein [Actinoplanes subtropicus]|uniref:tetratricopeptide repeat protein n=1 Tax=Actinoplanes subtropicus TaxID=543632 RepID=UPI000B1A7601|nr:tetratricopeptide repeat protein [Actinoplanes subtropicus]